VTAWRNALFAVFALCGLGLSGWAARIPAVSDGLDLGTADVGVLLLGAAVGSIVGLLASGHTVARFGAQTAIRWALVAMPIGVAIAGVGVTNLSSFAVTVAGLFVFGASMGICDVAMNVSGAANERALKRTVMPIYHAFFSFGTMAGAGIGWLAERIDLPLSVHLGLVAAAALIAGQFAVAFLRPEDHDDTDDSPEAAGWRERLAIWKDPRTLLIGVIVLGMAFAEGSANDWLAYAMVEGHGTDRPTGALVLGVFLTAMTAGRLAGVRALDKFGRVPVLRASAVLAFVGLLMLIAVPVTWIAIVGVVLWGLGASLGFPVGMSAAADDPRTAAARVSAVATIGYVAFLVGPPVIGFLGEQFGILGGLTLVLILVAAAGIVTPAARESAKVTAATPIP
jgi:fucose permease